MAPLRSETHRAPLLALALAVAAAAACGSDESGTASAGETKTGKVEPPRPPSVRTKLRPLRALLAESPRAELDVGGLLVDLGGPDQLKYTRGDWGTGWGKSQLSEDGVSYVGVPGGNARLELQLPADAPEVSARVRSAVAGQRVALVVDGKYLARADVTDSWSVARFDVSETPVPAGRHIVELRFEAPAKDDRGEVDWLWLRSDANAPVPAPLPRVLPIHLAAGTKRALPAPSSRTYSFYMHVPERASLVFDYGADRDVTFSVSAASDGAKPEQLFSKPVVRDQWTEARVDLSAFAGKAIRLDMTTSGPPAMAGWGEPEIMLEGPAPKLPTNARPPRNLIVILIDTVRADVFGPINPDNEVHTPSYDALAGEATVFVNAYNNENWTKPSVATTLSGLYPTTHDTKKDPSVLPDEIELLSQRMSKQGFATGGFIANGFISNKFGFEKGWDHFVNYIRENKPSEAERVYADALAWITEHKNERFFAYIQTIDPHVVYRVDKPYTDRYYQGDYTGKLGSSVTGHEQADFSKGKLELDENDLRWLRALYYGEVTYHDEHMGLFLQELKTLGLLDDTLLVVTNDHGEELNEHGRLGHGHSLYEELLRAPLLFRFPPLFPAGKKVTEVVENVDVSPTILEIMDLPPFEQADGVSLLPLLRGAPGTQPSYALSEFLDTRRAVRVGNWKLDRSTGDSIRLFDVANDPGEQTNRIDDAPIARRLCEIHMGEALASPNKAHRLERVPAKRRFQAGEAKIDGELKKQLEALGYFGG